MKYVYLSVLSFFLCKFISIHFFIWFFFLSYSIFLNLKSFHISYFIEKNLSIIEARKLYNRFCFYSWLFSYLGRWDKSSSPCCWYVLYILYSLSLVFLYSIDFYIIDRWLLSRVSCSLLSLLLLLFFVRKGYRIPLFLNILGCSLFNAHDKCLIEGPFEFRVLEDSQDVTSFYPKGKLQRIC